MLSQCVASVLSTSGTAVYDANATDYQLHNKNEGDTCLFACRPNEKLLQRALAMAMAIPGSCHDNNRAKNQELRLRLCMLVRATDYD